MPEEEPARGARGCREPCGGQDGGDGAAGGERQLQQRWVHPGARGGDPGVEPAAGSPRLRGSLLGLGIFIFKGQGEFCVGRRKVPSFTRSAEPRLRAPRSSVPAAQQLHLSLFPYRVPNPGGNEHHPMALCPLARQRFPPS